MWQSFINDFLLTRKKVWGHNIGFRNPVKMVKKKLTNEAYGIYGYFEPKSEKNEYILIAVAGYGDRKRDVRFFDNEFFGEIFSEEDRKELRHFSGRDFLSIEQVVQDMNSSFAGKYSEKQLLHLPGSIDDKEEQFYRIDVSRFQFDPTAKKTVNEYTGTVLYGLGYIYKQEIDYGMCCDGYGWYREMARRWLASTIYPNYPYFDMQHEKDAFLSTIDCMTEEILVDPTDAITKALAMKRAVEGHEMVVVEFVCIDGTREQLKIFASAFQENNFSFLSNDDTIEFDFHCHDDAALKAVSGKVTSVLYKEYDDDEPIRWINKEDVIAIRDEKGNILWSA